MEKNLDNFLQNRVIADTFCQSLGPSLYGGSTVILQIIYERF